MRPRAILTGALLLAMAPPAYAGGDVVASAPLSRSVTIYRAPGRNGGQMQLDALGGFAVITEIRDVALPAGAARVRLEGVADGIVPESAIVTGLPGGVIEKNRDDALLSPSALLKAAVGRQVMLTRTNPKTGKHQATAARIISASDQGVVFSTAAGNEALRCDGVAEGLAFLGLPAGLSARPTLSVRTRSAWAIHARVKLTYIAENFDWNANYIARLSADGTQAQLGGWITLANGNGVSLPDAQTQIVAGGLNRAYVARYLNAPPQVIARCWPMAKTSDIPEKDGRPYELVRPWMGEQPSTDDVVVTARRMFAMAVPASIMNAAPPPPPPAPKAEQLGDLKLYRLPERTTIAARQMKQSRLIDQSGVAVERFYRAEVGLAPWMMGTAPQAMTSMLRMLNDKAHGLGLPLPAGAVLIEQAQGASGQIMMLGEPTIRDTAEGEKLELAVGQASEMTFTWRWAPGSGPAAPREVMIDLANASPASVPVELRLPTYGGWHVARVDGGQKVDGVMTVKLSLAAGDRRSFTVTLAPD